jgi:eukaryotic-like serine/threonine-protein kinase
MGMTSGTRLGPYALISPIGAGGMGEVYRAHDTRLNRTVAIKVLPNHLAADPLARARFVREGQALAALAHPNLVAIYDVGTESGVSFAVMELVEGETLHAKLLHGRLPVRRVVDYAVQIARGLSAAHDKGLVHRDLKPANVIVAADGHVKILDFGLAKTADSGTDLRADAETAVRTDPGMIMGTVGYMAPEQVRGLATDARTDLFAFGALMYEMATGRRAFDRESAAETMTAIVKDDPAAIPADLDVSPALDRIMRRCLEKRPDDRFRSAADLAFQLDTLSASSGRVEAAASEVAQPRRPLRALWAAAIFIAGLLAGWFVLSRVVAPRSPATSAVPTRTSTLTYSGSDLLPAASPDGRTIAFTSSRDGINRIWLRQLSTGEEAALTSGNDHAPRFSPDGASILFARREGDDSSLYRIPVVGGHPRKLIDQAFEGDWSPDGTRLAFVRQKKPGDWRLCVAAADGSNIREGQDALTTALRGPRWSPDGRSIVVTVSGIQATISDRLLVVDAATLAGTLVDPIEAGGHISNVQWSGSDFLYAQTPDVTSYAPESRIVLQYRSGGGRVLAWVPALVDGFDLQRDGSVVFDSSTNRQNLREFEWTPSGLSSAGRWLTRGTSMDRQPAYSPDGKWVIFNAMRSGNLDLWLTSPETGETRRLTDDQAQDWDPAFTPDGKQLIWSSNRSGHFEIWIAEADGRNARQLSRDGFDAENPTATRDGWIVYGANGSPNEGVWKIRLDGSQATKIVAGINAHPELSPDGQHVLYHTAVIGVGHVHVVRKDDGRQVIPPIPLPPAGRLIAKITPGRGRWRADGRAIVFVGADANGASVLYEQAFRPGEDTSPTRRVLKKSDESLSVESFGISPDGKHVTISFIEDQYAVMRLDGLGLLRK